MVGYFRRKYSILLYDLQYTYSEVYLVEFKYSIMDSFCLRNSGQNMHVFFDPVHILRFDGESLEEFTSSVEICVYDGER